MVVGYDWTDTAGRRSGSRHFEFRMRARFNADTDFQPSAEFRDPRRSSTAAVQL
jgi:hypothetical protein